MGKLAEIFGGNIGDTVAKIIGLFKLSPEVAAQHAADLEKMQFELQEKLLDAAQTEIQTAGENIRADAQSGDKYTSRARPSFIYLMLAILGYNYIVAPIAGRTPVVFPDALFWLFGSCMLGYTGARTWEKFMGADGESKFSFMGLNASNISPTKGSK